MPEPWDWLSAEQLDHAPNVPGSYALRLFMPALTVLTIGRLGKFEFLAGRYIYCGSAMGPGGIRGRLKHHARLTSSPHWHIDALRFVAEIEAVYWQTGSPPQECAWSQAWARLPEVAIPVKGFGASDCRQGCPAHLVFIG